jgi:hypothetical protein
MLIAGLHDCSLVAQRGLALKQQCHQEATLSHSQGEAEKELDKL